LGGFGTPVEIGGLGTKSSSVCKLRSNSDSSLVFELCAAELPVEKEAAIGANAEAVLSRRSYLRVEVVFAVRVALRSTIGRPA
jgi:hypothetical protein